MKNVSIKVKDKLAALRANHNLGLSASIALITFLLGGSAIISSGLALYASKKYTDQDIAAWPVMSIELMIEQPKEPKVTIADGPDHPVHSPPQDQAITKAPAHDTPPLAEQSDDTAKPAHTAIDLSHDDSIFQEIAEGFYVPKRTDEKTAFSAYKVKPFDHIKTAPYKGIIALVMTDYGLSKRYSEIALETFKGYHLNYAVSSYAPNMQTMIDKARTQSHEAWLSAPMQDINFPFKEAGAAALLVKSKEDENRRRLIWALSQAKGYPGVINDNTSSFAFSDSSMDLFLRLLNDFGIGYVDGDILPNNLASTYSKRYKIPFAQNNVWINPNHEIDNIDSNLYNLKSRALSKGQAIGFFAPQPEAIETIKDWLLTAESEGIIFVPLSYLTENSTLN